LILIFFFLLAACENKQEEITAPASVHCRGIIRETDSRGAPRFMFERFYSWTNSCVKDFLNTPRWYLSEFNRMRKNIVCTPQHLLPSMSLKSSGNYYSYRDDRMYLQLNSETGEFKRVILGEDSSGNTLFERQVGCFYLREDLEEEPVNPRDHGLQLLLHLADSAASTLNTPNEIFKVNRSSDNHLELWRYDYNDDVEWNWCPELTPFEFCKELRNGNILYYPTGLSNDVKLKLQAEAILIRSEYNYLAIDDTVFNSLWHSLDLNFKEVGIDFFGKDFQRRFIVNTTVDSHIFIEKAWVDYVKGVRSHMPDVSSYRGKRICYAAYKRDILPSGEPITLKGRACYENGIYVFEDAPFN
jgi:hypothetical protein